MPMTKTTITAKGETNFMAHFQAKNNLGLSDSNWSSTIFDFIFHPIKIATNKPDSGSMILAVMKSINSKKLNPAIFSSAQILKEKTLPNPIIHAMKPKARLAINLVHFLDSIK